MVRWASVIIASVVMVTGQSLGHGGSRAHAQVAEAVTVGSVIVQARSLVKEIDDRASALLRQGNSVTAQLQMQLSGLVRWPTAQIATSRKGTFQVATLGSQVSLRRKSPSVASTLIYMCVTAQGRSPAHRRRNASRMSV